MFGHDQLCRGSGVLDVAGGKGVLAFELLNVHGIPCTVVDPRPLSLKRYCRLFDIGFYHKKSRLSDVKELEHYSPPRDSTAGALLPRHIRAFLNTELCQGAFGALTTSFESLFMSNLAQAESTVWTPNHGLHCDDTHHEDQSDESELDIGRADEQQAGFAQTIREADTAASILRNCSCVVGMHPDQAAAPLVEFAVEHGKSFAVVPCCVYATQIRRTFSDGRPVSSYEDLLEYLQSLAPGIQRTVLPYLEGKNTVIYRV